MPELPQGTVTFLFTDIEGSTQLWERFPEEMKPTMARHDTLLRSCVEQNRGVVVKTTGDGCHAVFARAQDGETIPWRELYIAARESGLNKTTLAKKLNVSEGVGRRLLNPQYQTKIVNIDKALKTMGKRMVISMV